MKKTTAILVIMAWGVAALATAQEDVPTGRADQSGRTVQLSLSEAIELAKGTSPRLEEFRAMISLAEAGKERASAEKQPHLSTQAGYRRYNNVPEWTVQLGPEEILIFPNLPNLWFATLSGSYPLYTGGRVESEVRAAEHTISASNKDLESQTANLELQVTSIYWQLVLSIEQERILAESISSFDAHLFDAQNRQDVGLAASNEALAVRTERDRAELRRLLAASAVKTTQDQLAVLLDLPVGTAVEPTDQLNLGAEPAMSVDALLASALEDRTERHALKQRIAAAEAKLDAATSLKKPIIAINGSMSYLNPDRRVVPPSDDFRFAWDIGIGLTYDIYEGGSRNAAANAALAELDATRRRLEELDRAIRTEVVQSFQSLETARAAIDVAERAIASARENLRVSRDLYQEGIIPSSERLDAEVAELIAGLELTESKIQAQLASASLQRAVGRSLTSGRGLQDDHFQIFGDAPLLPSTLSRQIPR
jgi:outer membrane protein TolC